MTPASLFSIVGVSGGANNQLKAANEISSAGSDISSISIIDKKSVRQATKIADRNILTRLSLRWISSGAASTNFPILWVFRNTLQNELCRFEPLVRSVLSKWYHHAIRIQRPIIVYCDWL